MGAGKSTRSFALLCVASFFMYGVNNVMISRAPLMVMDMGASATAAGFQGTFFIVFAIVLRTVLMPLTSRIGTKRLMLLGAASFVAASALFPFCTTYAAFLGARAVQAAGLAVFWPLSVSAVVDVSDAGNVGQRLGVSRFATAASMAVGPYAAFALDDAMGASWLYGALFLASALAIVALAACKLPDEAAHEKAGEQREESGVAAQSAETSEQRMVDCAIAGNGCAGALDRARADHVAAGCEVAEQLADDAGSCESTMSPRSFDGMGEQRDTLINRADASAEAVSAAAPFGNDERLKASYSRSARHRFRVPFAHVGAGSMWLAGVLLVTLVDSAAAGLVMHFSAVAVGEFDGSLNAASYLSLYSIGGMIASLLLGRALDQGKCAIVLPACIAAFGLGVLQLGSSHMTFAGLVAGGMLAGAGNSGAALCCMDIITRKAPPRLRDAALGYRQSCVDIGIAVAATAFGAAFDVAPANSVVFLAWGGIMLCFAAAVCANIAHIARKQRG